MRNKPIQADQLIPTSSTPPPEAGFYRIDRHTIGVVGDMSFRDPDTQVVMPVGKGAIPFTNFAPRLLASLAASSTAACTSGVVTVTATAHTIPATVYDGWQFYYPGSPNLAAGWYANFARTGADTCTFSAPASADFTSESVNAGAALVDEVTVASITLPANTISGSQIIRCPFFLRGDGTSNTRTTRLKVGTDIVGITTITSSASTAMMELSCATSIATRVHGAGIRTHSFTTSEYDVTIDPTAELTFSLTQQISAAGSFAGITGAVLRIE